MIDNLNEIMGCVYRKRPQVAIIGPLMFVSDGDDSYPSQLTPLQTEHWVAARILHANNTPACLVGPAASAFYGSDDLWIRVMIVVNDPAFDDACETLRENAYQEVSMDDDEHLSLQPSYPYPDGKEPVRWRLLSPVDHGGFSVVLAPASHWHFCVSEETTIVVDGYPLPKYVPYLQALMSVLIHRLRSSIPPGYFVSQTLNVLALQHKYTKKLPLVDRFIFDHYFSVRRAHNRLRVVELWENLKQGVLTVQEAVALVPIEKRREVGW